jgi:hypothetical protein
MKQDKKNKKIWYAKIPKQKKGTKIKFYIVAYDIAGNKAIEILPSVKNFPPEDKELNLIIVDPDDPEDWVPPDLDIKNCWFGYDEENFYFKLKVQGRFTKMAKGVFRVHGYIIALINTDLTKELNIMDAHCLIYSPALRTILGVEPYGLYKFLEIEKGAIKEADVKKHLDKKNSPNIIYFKFKRNALGENPSKLIKISALTLGVSNFLAGTTPVPWDATNYVNLYLRWHEFEIR